MRPACVHSGILCDHIIDKFWMAIIIYEFMITFSKEVELFWKRNFTLSSVLFLVNRYVSFAVNMMYTPWPSYAQPATLAVRALCYISISCGRADMYCSGRMPLVLRQFPNSNTM